MNLTTQSLTDRSIKPLPPTPKAEGTSWLHTAAGLLIIGLSPIVPLLLIVLVTFRGGTSSALPLAKAGTQLRKIQDRGQLIVGTKYDLPSFGYLNPKTNNVEGFDAEVAREIAGYIFGDRNRVDFREAVTKDRETNLKNGTFDVILATYIISEDRLKDVDFSIVYYVGGPRLLVNKDSTIKSIADVDGKKVATTKGSVFIPVLTRLTKADLVAFDTQGEAAQELLKHNIEAVVANDPILYALSLANQGSLKVVGPQFSQEYYGAGVGKGNPEFLDLVNTVIRNLKSSGKWKNLWKAEVGEKFGIATIPDPPPDEWPKQ
jgi:aspartate/glutamate/glutamine transport system substrate-binding protein